MRDRSRVVPMNSGNQMRSIMKRNVSQIAIVSAVTLGLLWSAETHAQTFSSGSTGALGAFSPTGNTTVTLPPDGVLNYTTVTIPAGVTVNFAKNAANTSVTLLATGDVTLAGTINVNGVNGTGGTGSGPLISPGGVGGPGGFPGGAGASRGGGIPAAAGQGPGGGAAGSTGGLNQASYGAPGSFVSLLPILGGSGGGGGDAFTIFGVPQSGGSAGGGGGAIVLASSTKITVTGSIMANGGIGAVSCAGVPDGGHGSGGAIRLVAPQVTGPGMIHALGGSAGACISAGAGRIRLEAFTLTFSGATSPTASTSPTPGPVTAASNPALTNVPTLSISSVGGIAMPSVPTGSYTTADVALPGGTANPVPVAVTATNTPLGSIFTVKVIPQSGSATTFNSSVSTGTFAVSTAIANVNFPAGTVSVLNVFATVTLTAALRPEFDGEAIERVLVAAGLGGTSSITLVTTSGKEVAVEQLPVAEQVKLASALEELRTRTQASTGWAR